MDDLGTWITGLSNVRNVCDFVVLQTDVHPQHTEIRDVRHRKINFVHNEVHDRGCSFRRDNDDRSASGSRHRRTGHKLNCNW